MVITAYKRFMAFTFIIFIYFQIHGTQNEEISKASYFTQKSFIFYTYLFYYYYSYLEPSQMNAKDKQKLIFRNE